MSFLTLNRQILWTVRDRRDHGEISNDLSDRRRGVGSSCQCQDKKDPDHVGSHENHADI